MFMHALLLNSKDSQAFSFSRCLYLCEKVHTLGLQLVSSNRSSLIHELFGSLPGNTVCLDSILKHPMILVVWSWDRIVEIALAIGEEDRIFMGTKWQRDIILHEHNTEGPQRTPCSLLLLAINKSERRKHWNPQQRWWRREREIASLTWQ